jgi:hypothetical protein
VEVECMTEGVFSLTGSVERVAFEIYLRTGRHVPTEQIAVEIELKFNPWHDPEDGPQIEDIPNEKQ